MEIRGSFGSELEAIQGLLRASDLPADDLTEAHLEHFLVAQEGGSIVGSVGLEPRASTGLLRSLAVAPEMRHHGLGTALADAAEHLAAERGLHELYLLTTTAEQFFARRGYEVIDRVSAPAEMQQTIEFREACPQTAVCMTRTL